MNSTVSTKAQTPESNNNPTTFGEWAKHWRDEESKRRRKRVTIVEAAKRVQRPYSWLSRIERDEPKNMEGIAPQRDRATVSLVARIYKIDEEFALKCAGYSLAPGNVVHFDATGHIDTPPDEFAPSDLQAIAEWLANAPEPIGAYLRNAVASYEKK